MLRGRGLLKRVADIVIDAVTIGADEMTAGLVEADASTFDLDHKDAQLWMSDDEIRFAVPWPTHVVGANPRNMAMNRPRGV